MPEITRYNRGLWKVGPLEQAADGELVFAKDIQQLVNDLYRLEGVVKDLNAAVENLTRILAYKNGRIDSAVATCDECDKTLQTVKKWNRTWRWLNFLLVSMVVFQAGVIKGWW